MLKSVHFLSALVLATFLVQSPTAFGQLNIIWTGATDTDWADGSNWNAGVPGSADTAFIIDGAITPATISSVVPTVVGVHIGQGGTSSTSADFEGDGDVDLDDLGVWNTDYGNNDFSDADGDFDSDGTDFLIWQRQVSGSTGGTADGQVDIVAGGSLTTTNFVSLGTDTGNDGTLNVSGGSLNTGNLFVGNSSDTSPSLGTANFSGGTVTTTGTLFVGAGNNTSGSSVTQSGTSDVTADNVHVGEASTASYTLSGGTLTVNNINDPPDNEFAGLTLGQGAAGTFIHSGGTLNHNGGHLGVGVFNQGTYQMPVGSTGVVNINGGQLLIGNEDTTGGGSLFDQDGGTVNSNVITIVGRSGALPATYDISGGALNTPHIAVGTSTATSGSTFIQSGGTVTTPVVALGAGDIATGGAGSYTQSGGILEMGGTGSGSLIQIGNGNGANGSSFSISGGTLNVESINPGAFGQGTLNISGTADVNVSGNLQISAAEGSGGSAINQSGGTMDAGFVFVGVSGGDGAFNMTGGTTNLTGGLRVGGNALAAGSSVTQSGGTMNTDHIIVGPLASASYDQTGGVVTTTRLDIGGDLFAPAEFSTGVYNMSAGTFDGTGGAFLDSIGPNPGGTGTLNLSGTASYTSEAIVVGDNLGASFDGSLTGKDAGGTGTLSITGPNVNVALNGVWIGETGTLEFTAGTTISTIVTSGGIPIEGGGAFLLGDLVLDLSALASNADLTLIDNTNSLAQTQGFFAGLPEGTTFNDSTGTKTVTITYQGGTDGNDVLLTNIVNALSGATSVPEPSSLVLFTLAGLGYIARRKRSSIS